MRHRVILTCLSALVLGFVADTGETRAQETKPGFRVIVNEVNPAESLSRARISRLMLRKSARWEDGTPALPVDLPESSSTRESFDREIHGRSSQAVASYWQRQIFAGDQVPPPTLPSDEAVVAFVRERPGAIGYVSPSARLTGVRELKISDR